MKLDEYLNQPGATEAAFAERLGVSTPTVNRIRRGLQEPKPALARLIVRITEGLVSMNALYGLPEEPVRKASKKKARR